MNTQATDFTASFFQHLKASDAYARDSYFRSFCDIFAAEADIDLLSGFGADFIAERVNRLYTYFLENYGKGRNVKVTGLTGDEGGGFNEAVEIYVLMDDCPFIVDSILEHLKIRGYRLLSLAHPLLFVEELDGQLNTIRSGTGDDERTLSFSWITAECAQPVDPQKLAEELDFITLTLVTVHQEMTDMKDLMYQLSLGREGSQGEDLLTSEGRQLFKWMLNDNAFLLGSGALPANKLNDFTGWDSIIEPRGMMRIAKDTADSEFQKLIYNGLVHFSLLKQVFNLIELPRQSAIYRPDQITLCMHKGVNADGQHMFYIFALLFTPSSLHFKPNEIPIARLKLNAVIEKNGIVPQSHNYRDVESFFMQFPRSEIFRMDRDELNYILQNIHLNSWKHRDLKIFHYFQKQRNYLHITVLVPANQYYPNSRTKLRGLLRDEFGVVPNFDYRFDHLDKIHCHFVYWGESLIHAEVNEEQIKKLIRSAFSNWEDQLFGVAENARNPEIRELIGPGKRYSQCFQDHYIIDTTPEEGFYDICQLIELERTKSTQLSIKPLSEGNSRLSLYSDTPLILRQTLGVLEKCRIFVTNYNEYSVSVAGTQYIYRYDITHRQTENDPDLYSRLGEVVLKLIMNPREADAIYSLAVYPSMNYGAIRILKIYRDYFIQIIPSYRDKTLNDALYENPETTILLKDYFLLKFNTVGDTSVRYQDETHLKEIKEQLVLSLTDVKSLTSDMILRVFISLIGATVRTNLFQPDQQIAAVKIDCGKSEYIPTPKMMYEIFVQDGIMQGIHMRGSKVARGGIRFSDREDDYRIEILRLTQAQMLKNAVIVPLGSKGGYTVRQKWNSRADMLRDSEFYYRRYIGALLSLTDNIIDGKVIPPPSTVCYDDEDPYLVVAADKGTASYSDIANEISQKYGFWLDDAFASGGSSGYGHKSLAITAKGAWECVKMHFREIGKDIQEEPFTVVGIGDMSGDVFGNGMLLSKQIRLVAAFNHLHIFIDPNPDPAVSFTERERLAALPSSGWNDYAADLISSGGGVFDRSEKSIPLSPEIQTLLNTDKNTMSGVEIIKSLLRLNVDLLWNGGIGTYIKATDESHSDVGDSHNNDVRVNGAEVRAKVIGEGGNLGVSPKGRVEYERTGGRINADSIDNAAGVNLSDHEVNVKILLRALQENGQINDAAERNRVLQEMSAAMVRLCMQDNVDNSLMISMDQRRSLENMGFFIAQIEHLVRHDGLNRDEANILGNRELMQLASEHRPIPRSTLSIVSGYTKNYLKRRIIDSSIPDNRQMHVYFETYFPVELQERFDLKNADHRLKREIIAMRLANYFVNTGGVTFIAELANMTRCRSHAIVTGFMVIDLLFDEQAVSQWICAIPQHHTDTMFEWLKLKETMLRREIIWILTNHKAQEISFDLIDKFRDTVDEIRLEVRERYTAEQVDEITAVFAADQVNAPSFTIEYLLPIFENMNYLELASLKMNFQLTLSQAEKLLAETENLFGLIDLERKVINFKSTSFWEINHLGLLIIRINHMRQELYRRMMSTYSEADSLDQAVALFTEKNGDNLKRLVSIKLLLAKEEDKMLSAVEYYLRELETRLEVT